MKILTVCTGNICRSPMAEGLLRARFRTDAQMMVDSAGTHGYHIGEKPDPRAITVMKRHGIDISGIRARQLEPADLIAFDLILVATVEHQQMVERLRPAKANARIEKMLASHPQLTDQDLYDPYYGNENDFETTYQQLLAAFVQRFGQ